MKKRVFTALFAALMVTSSTMAVSAAVPDQPIDGQTITYGNGTTVVYRDGSNVQVENDDLIVTFDNARTRAWYNDGLIWFESGYTAPNTSEPNYNYLYAIAENEAKTLDLYVNVSRNYYTDSKKKNSTSYSSGRVWDSADGRIDGKVTKSSPLGWYSSSNKANFGYNNK